jgi:copper chaperone NosL
VTSGLRGTILLLSTLAVACGEPRPGTFTWGSDGCDHCHMTLTDPRFAAQLVTTKHKVHRFDDPGCLANFLVEGEVPATAVHSLWVNDFLAPDRLLRVEDAVFLRSDSLRTPMDSRLAALTPGPAADSLRSALVGDLLTWDQVLAQARERVTQ